VVQRVVRHHRAIGCVRLPPVEVANLRKDLLSQAGLGHALLRPLDQNRRQLQTIDAKAAEAPGAQRLGDGDLDAGIAGADADQATNAGSLEALQDETGIEFGGVAGAEHRAHPQCQIAVRP
jgi:hypothetical protein